jgi:carbon-monoxide dehydrogenase medium subunit
VWSGTDPSEIDSQAIAEEVDPTADLTGSERYKRHVTGVYVRRALAALAEVGER